MLYNRKKWRLAIYILAIIVAISLIGACSRESIDESAELITPTHTYDTNAHSELALAQLNAGDVEPATVLQRIGTARKIVFLSLDGITDIQTTQRLLQLLSDYNADSTFFLPGIKTAENPDSGKLIAAQGYSIGSYTLKASVNMQQYDQQILVDDFARTNEIINIVTGKPPTVMKCRATQYTSPLLQAAGASDISMVVQSDHDLSYQSFRTQHQTDAFVQGLIRGDFIALKIDSVLNEEEYKMQSSSSSTASEQVQSSTALPPPIKIMSLAQKISW